MTLPSLGRYKDVPVSLAKLRKDRHCIQCSVGMVKGQKAYRSMLFATVNGVIRCDRICPECMRIHGVFLK